MNYIMKIFKNRTVKTLVTLLLLIVAVPIACDTSLDVEPVEQTEASFFETAGDFDESVIGIYAKFTDIYNYNGGGFIHGMWHLPGDGIATTGDFDFETFNPITTTTGAVGTYWNAAYEMVNRANIVLEKLEAAEGVYQDQSLKDAHKGEALFLRGYINFQIWNFFGSHAPLITERIEGTENISPPSSNEGDQWSTEILDQAITDLREATSLLPPEWDEENRGRVTNNSAYGILGKALVFRATISDNSSDFTEAISSFNNISGRALTSNYGDNFSANAENNIESLLEFQASEPPGNDNVWLPNEFNQNVGSMSAYFGFYENDFSLFGAQPFIPTEKLKNRFDEDDPRIDFIMGPLGEPLQDRSTIVKYVRDGEKSGTNVGSVNNPRMLRYADVLLLKAEAIIQSGGSTTEAIGLINQVRERARNTANPASSEPANYSTNETDTDTIMDWIMNERFLELAGDDNHRWFDLRRWHKADIIDLGNFDFSSPRGNFNIDLSKHLFYPIPQTEIEANDNVVQNQGY